MALTGLLWPNSGLSRNFKLNFIEPCKLFTCHFSDLQCLLPSDSVSHSAIQLPLDPLAHLRNCGATVFFVFIEIRSFRDSRNIQKLHHHHTTIFCQVRLPSGNIWYLLVEMLVKQWRRHFFPYNDAVSEQEQIPLIRTVRYLQTRRWHTTCCGPSQLWPFLGPSWSSTPSAMRHDPRRYMTWCDVYENACCIMWELCARVGFAQGVYKCKWLPKFKLLWLLSSTADSASSCLTLGAALTASENVNLNLIGHLYQRLILLH